MKSIYLFSVNGYYKKTSSLPVELLQIAKKKGIMYEHEYYNKPEILINGVMKYPYCNKFTSAFYYDEFFMMESLRKEGYRMRQTKVIYSDSLETAIKKNKDSKFFRFLDNARHFAKVDKCNYITLRRNERITYHPRPERQEFNDAGDWKRDGRQEIKPLQLLKLLFGAKVEKYFTNADIEAASTKIKAFDQLPQPKETTFDEIYDLNMEGWSQTSCMNGKNYTDLYENNKDVFTAIKWIKNGEIVGRCLRVTAINSKTNEEFSYYDRIYYKKHEDLEGIRNQIDEEGKYHRKYNNDIGDNNFYFNGGSYRSNIEISAKLDTNWCLPYMDTLNYYCTENDQLQNFEPSEGYKLCSTYGGMEEINQGIYDEIDRCYIDEDDAVEIDFGNHRGCYTHRDNCFYSENNNGYILN